MTRPIFLDTEFTGLDQREPRLISLALVPEAGDETLYLELPREEWIGQASYWTQANVVPCLCGGEAVVSTAELRHRIADWLDRQGAVRVVTDYPEYDSAFLKAIMRPWHEGLHPEPIKFGASSLGELHRPYLEQARTSFYSVNQPAHNALMDACALRGMWNAALELSPRFAAALGLD